jgi:prepilin signal peptidase PulO-like enzyme (type II secretory pathway)
MAATALDASLVVLLAVVTVTDLRSRLVPDLALAVALAAALALCLASDPAGMPGRLLAAAGAGAFFLAAALLRPGGMGLGDVKLAAVIGFYLGTRVIEAVVVAFAAGSVAGLFLLARYGWAARRRAIPFAPCLALGALAAMAAQP